MLTVELSIFGSVCTYTILRSEFASNGLPVFFDSLSLSTIYGRVLFCTTSPELRGSVCGPSACPESVIHNAGAGSFAVPRTAEFLH